MARKVEKKVQKYNYYDAEGKRKCKTFTAYGDKELALKIAAFELSLPKNKDASKTTLEAVEGYIDSRRPVLSPVTIKQYESIQHTHIENDTIASIHLPDLSVSVLQAWVNYLVEKGAKPKTIKNCFGLLKAAIKMYDKDVCLDDVRLPQPIRYNGYTPGDSEVQTFIQYIKEKDRDLYIATLLAAFGPMRRSEICALTSDDIKGSSVSVHRAKVPGPGEIWITKETPKTDASNRTIIYPDFVAKELKGISGDVISCTPTAITKRFQAQIKKAGLPHCRFHDLRHYGASIMHAMGVPDVYIVQRGGWSSDYVMKRVYRDALDEEQKKQTANINDHFSKLIEAKSEAKIAES